MYMSWQEQYPGGGGEALEKQFQKISNLNAKHSCVIPIVFLPPKTHCYLKGETQKINLILITVLKPTGNQKNVTMVEEGEHVFCGS